MRFVLCLLLATLLSTSAFAAKDTPKDTMSLEEAQAAAAKGDAAAASAVATTTDQQTCLNACANRGYDKDRCSTACRPGLCHPNGQTPYCVSK